MLVATRCRGGRAARCRSVSGDRVDLPAYEPPPGSLMKTSYVTRDNFGMYTQTSTGPGPALMGANTLLGNDVYNKDGQWVRDAALAGLMLASSRPGWRLISSSTAALPCPCRLWTCKMPIPISS